MVIKKEKVLIFYFFPRAGHAGRPPPHPDQ